jgi:hypothetical protein
MTNRLSEIHVKFNDSVEMRNFKEECSSIVNATSLGIGANCFMASTKRLTISLGRSATIKPGDVLPFNLRGFSALDAATATKYTQDLADVSVLAPSRVIVPRLFIRAPSEVGACETVLMKAHVFYGAGGRPVTWKWTIDWAASVNQSKLSANDKSKISSLNSTLEFTTVSKLSLASSVISVGKGYAVTLAVTNFLGYTTTQSVNVQWVDSSRPIVYFGRKSRKVSPMRTFVLQVMAKTSPCVNDSGNALAYHWTTDFEISQEQAASKAFGEHAIP